MNNRALHVLVALMTLSVVAVAQESDFEQMVARMDRNSLPLVNIETDESSLVMRGPYCPAVFTVSERVEGRDSLVSRPLAGLVKFRGGITQNYDKRSFSIKFLDEAGNKLDVNLLGLREDNVWILDAMTIDRARMRNRVLFDLWNEYSRTPYETKFGGRNGTVGQMVEVFLNGEYHGLYCLSDKINRQLLGLKKVKVDEETSDVTVRGVLYKGEQWGTATMSMTGYKNARTDTVYWNGWQLDYPDDYPSRQAWQPLMDFITFINSDDDVFAAGYLDWYYRDNLVDYWLLLETFNILDMPYKNSFVSTVDVTSGDHHYLITPWDMDASMGQNYNGARQNTVCDIHRLDKDYMPFFSLIRYNIDDFYARLAARWKQLSRSTFAPEHVLALMSAYAARLDDSGAWGRERARWNKRPVALATTAAGEFDYIEAWYRNNFEHVQRYMLHDVNRDWTVDVGDVNLLLEAILAGNNDAALDANDDGAVDVGDVNNVLAVILNIK